MDKSKADAMIKDLNEANEVLTDPIKKRRSFRNLCPNAPPDRTCNRRIFILFSYFACLFRFDSGAVSDSASVSSSSSSCSSSSEDSEYDSNIGAKRKQPGMDLRQPPSVHSELPTPVLKLKNGLAPSAMSANDASGKTSSQSSHLQQSPRPVPDPASKVLALPLASLSDSARQTAVNSKFTGSEKILKPPAAFDVASGGQLPPSIAASNPIKELDLQQRWREKQATAPQIKRELPPLPSFHTTSLPPLPELPALRSLASAKSKHAVIADVKPAPVNVSPPSPVHPCVHVGCCASPSSISHVAVAGTCAGLHFGS